MSGDAPRRRREDRRGSALVELALVGPVLLVLLIGMFEFGLLGLRHMAMTGAVRAGVEYAAQYDDEAGTRRAVQSAAGNPDATVAATRFCECSGAVVACGAAPCAGGDAQQVFARVSAQEDYTPIFLTADMIRSLLGTASTVSKTATFRVQ